MSQRKNKKIKDLLRRKGLLDKDTGEIDKQHKKQSKKAIGFTVNLKTNKMPQHWAGYKKPKAEKGLHEPIKVKSGVLIKRKFHKVFDKQ